MALRWIKARQTKYAAYAFVYIVVVLAIVVVVNILANRYNKSLDTTANHRYTLSPQTAKIVKGLKQDSTITYFNQSTQFSSGRDLLSEYANLSPRVHIQYVDPDKNPQLAREDNVSEYNTAVVQVGDKKYAAKSMTEEGITGAYIRDIKGSTRTVCFVTGSGEHQIDDSSRDGLSQFNDLLSKDQYDTKSIGLLEKAEVPADCTALVVAGPIHDYLQPEVDAIQKYVQNGGRALFLIDPPLQLGASTISPNDALASVLAGWGVTLDKDLVLDFNPIGQLAGLGPQVALVTQYDSQPIVDPMKGQAVGIPLVRSLQIQDTAHTAVQKLFDSSASSLATTNLSSAEINVRSPNNKKGPFTLAASGTYDTGKPNSQGRFVVVGSSSWIANRFLGFNANGDLALNAVNWLASDEDLISIRPKSPESQHITMTRAQLMRVRLITQFGFPLIVILAGVFIWWKRR